MPCGSGFGLSDKALVSYADYSVWQRQLAAFMQDVVQDRCILVGNSLGGYTSLAAAATNPELVAGVALLNGAGAGAPAQLVIAPAPTAAENPLAPSTICCYRHSILVAAIRLRFLPGITALGC